MAGTAPKWRRLRKAEASDAGNGSPVREHRDSIPEGAGPAGQPPDTSPSPSGLLRAVPVASAVEAVVIMPRKDGASRRLASEIALAKRIKKAREETPKKVPEEMQERPAGLAGSLFALLGEVPEYLQLDENAIWDRPILKAFKEFDLDPCYLSEWRQLLGHLAYVLFPEHRPGAPQKWTEEHLCRQHL